MSTVTYGCDDFALHNSAKYASLPLHRRIAMKVGDVFCAMRHRAELRQLMTGDPRLLEDIGISQSDVMSAMSRSIWDDPTEEIGQLVDRRHETWRKLFKRSK